MESQQQPRKGKSVEKVKREKPELHSSGSAHGLAESASFSLNYKHYHKYCARIPMKFYEKLELSSGDKVQLQDPSGEVWSVGIFSGHQQAGPRFCAGWNRFVRRNLVVVGDRLEFCYKAELGLIQVKIDRKEKNRVMASNVKIEEEEEEEEEEDDDVVLID